MNDSDFETWQSDGKTNTINTFDNSSVRTSEIIVDCATFDGSAGGKTRSIGYLENGGGTLRAGNILHVVTKKVE